MRKVLVVDDERTTLTVIQQALKQHEYETEAFADPREALAAFRTQRFDLVLSDYYMPGMGGAEFLAAVRQHDEDCPFIFLTGNADLQIAIELVKSGADDYIVKPIVVEELVFRVNRCIEDSERRRALERIRQEHELIELEHQKLVNWRQLYASKDIRQTEQMIRQLSQAVNQAGGYLWVDLLEAELAEPQDGAYRLSVDLADMVLKAARSQKEIMEYITFIGDIDNIELEMHTHEVPALMQEIVAFCREDIEGRLAAYQRPFSVGVPRQVPHGVLKIDKVYLKRILHELLVNAIKYSPEGSRLTLSLDVRSDSRGSRLEITIQNRSRAAVARDADGQPVTGIPYDYSETVFDLFYTIDQFPTELPEEEWRTGTGLYVCRKLLKRQGGWIRSGNGTDHTGDAPAPVVRTTITLPIIQDSGS
ncbi:hybrid sensor histidine kinase/response regulator [Spirochaeta africana]|uniref:Response regulator with CheY-like receiver, AAA-type ATPase, and DNA-binding domains n=1 Tax=Spirochaeta africana (strain ATCC 700263 / DSM 8902 / Z-7692) TaxID=889378 RepID=H9ULL6_SPIAZ|nr:response regulator [Spirochaeta africana]AFG38409.1 response regulator with CheY-like receiver, AAA-type ATPase, and DNA-binding domains [Spirochaeta africana DSM 8902]